MTEQSKHWDTAYEWKAVTLLTSGFGLVGLGRWIVGPLLPFISPDLHLNYRDAGASSVLSGWPGASRRCSWAA
jgi:hypothetical protein